MTEQMEGGSAGTLQLFTLPLELPPMLCTVKHSVMWHSFFCVSALWSQSSYSTAIQEVLCTIQPTL